MRRWILRLALLFLTIDLVPHLSAAGLIIVDERYWRHPTPPPVVPPPGHHPLPMPRPHIFAPLEVSSHQADVKITDQIAMTSIDQEFYNPNPQRLEGTFVFPVPKGAQLKKFSMEVDGKQVEAELMSADKARSIYEDIVRKARDPALLEYAGRDLLKVRIFPFEAHGRKRIKLSYSQVLKADSGLIAYAYPLNTEKYSAKPIQNLSLKVALETKRPLKSIYSPSQGVEIRRQDANKATVTYESKNARPDADFQLFFAPENAEIGLDLMTYRTGSEDGFFLLLASPGFSTADQQIVRKDVVFVLDTSGSMAGPKLEQAKKALQFCVANLNDGDRFEILRFASEIEPLFGKLAEATPGERERASEFIKGLKPIGGTAIDEALRRGLSVRPEPSDRPCLVIFLTDGLPTVGPRDEDTILANVKKHSGGNTRVFCFGIGHDVNTHLLDKITEETRAFSQYVLPEEDIEIKVSQFFTKIKEPVLTNPTITFPDSTRVTRLYPSPLPDLFKGEQVVAVGRYSSSGSGAIVIQGSVNGANRKFSEDGRFPESATEHDFIPRLWATRRVANLLDEIRLRGENPELKDEVTDLARRFGIVTPYTAYLILEDEVRREVPVALQSFPRLREDGAARDLAQRAWVGAKEERSGGEAIAAARYGLALKSSANAADAVALGREEAQRGLHFAAPTLSVQASAIGPAGPSVPTRIQQHTEQTRFVNGRNFFQNGTQWIDANVQKLDKTKLTRIQFNSPEYFAFQAKHPEARPWLALGQNVQFALSGVVYEIYE